MPRFFMDKQGINMDFERMDLEKEDFRKMILSQLAEVLPTIGHICAAQRKDEDLKALQNQVKTMKLSGEIRGLMAKIQYPEGILPAFMKGLNTLRETHQFLTHLLSMLEAYGAMDKGFFQINGHRIDDREVYNAIVAINALLRPYPGLVPNGALSEEQKNKLYMEEFEEKKASFAAGFLSERFDDSQKN